MFIARILILLFKLSFIYVSYIISKLLFGIKGINRIDVSRETLAMTIEDS